MAWCRAAFALNKYVPSMVPSCTCSRPWFATRRSHSFKLFMIMSLTNLTPVPTSISLIAIWLGYHELKLRTDHSKGDSCKSLKLGEENPLFEKDLQDTMPDGSNSSVRHHQVVLVLLTRTLHPVLLLPLLCSSIGHLLAGFVRVCTQYCLEWLGFI